MTEAELLQALVDSRHLADEGSTVREIMDATGWGKEKVLRKLRIAIQEGKVRVTRKQVIDIAGRPNHAPAYVRC